MTSPLFHLSQTYLPTSSKHQSVRGFSLIEVLVTLSIISILTVLVMFRYGSFNSAVLLNNQAFEVALDLREAQVFAISVRGSSNEFREEYGIFLDLNEPNQYVFWLDDNSNGAPVTPVYDEAPANELVQLRTIDSRFVLQDICVNNDDSCGIAELHVSFARPDFDAAIWAVDGSSTGPVQSARLVFSPENDSSITRSVLINSTGQITVE